MIYRTWPISVRNATTNNAHITFTITKIQSVHVLNTKTCLVGHQKRFHDRGFMRVSLFTQLHVFCFIKLYQCSVDNDLFDYIVIFFRLVNMKLSVKLALGELYLSNGPCKKDSTRGKECRKVLTFAQLCYCCIIILIGSISTIYQTFRQLSIYLSLIDQLFSFQQNLF